MSYKKDVKKIYDNPEYIEKYPDLHIVPALEKHKKNILNIRLLLKSRDGASWLDVCCGRAWHFSNIPGGDRFEKIGIDISSEHIKVAKENNPGSEFICDDFLDYDFKEKSFDVVSCFWGSYCYLDTQDQIYEFINKMINLTSAGGGMYLEAISPHSVTTFPGSNYERDSFSSVELLTKDASRWKFIDFGGTHVLLSPPIEDIVRFLKKSFSLVRCSHASWGVHHIICHDKKN